MTEPTSIPTPRTDAAKITILDAYESHSVVVPFYKMAELERENAVLREALRRCKPDALTGSPEWFEITYMRSEALTPPTTI